MNQILIPQFLQIGGECHMEARWHEGVLLANRLKWQSEHQAQTAQQWVMNR